MSIYWVHSICQTLSQVLHTYSFHPRNLWVLEQSFLLQMKKLGHKGTVHRATVLKVVQLVNARARIWIRVVYYFIHYIASRYGPSVHFRKRDSLSGQIKKNAKMQKKFKKMHPRWGDVASHDFTPNTSFGQGLCAVCRMYNSAWQPHLHRLHYLSLLLQMSGNFHMHDFMWFWLQPY